MKELLKYKKIFKLILGAGNEDIESIKKLIFLYDKAGADVFDIKADIRIINEVAMILPKNKFICASIGLGDDIHIQKAKINSNCSSCKSCLKSCIQAAIKDIENKIFIEKEKCIGCKNCSKFCNNEAINFYSETKDFKIIYDEIKNLPINYIEIHTNNNDYEVFKCIEYLNKNFSGELGICLSGNKLNDIEKIELIKKLQQKVHPKKLIIQADGTSMSGLNNKKVTTQKALKAAEYFARNLKNIYLISSGGTNSNTSKLAKENNISLDGVAIGTYARKIVSEYIQKEDFYSETIFNQALQQAKSLVQEVKTHL